MRLVESIPNFSEGRRPEVLRALESAATRSGAHVLDVDSDTTHHRVVISLAAFPEPLLEALFEAISAAVEHIDLRTHAGVHPRMGAADVVPLVPLGSTGRDTCIDMAHDLAARVWHELRVPVYLYGAALGGPSLAEIRAGRASLAVGDVAHATAGATCIGVRQPLVAYNILLPAASREQAVAIARGIRESGGGLPGVQALAFDLGGGQMQLSMNLVDLEKTGLRQVRGRVSELCRELGISDGPEQVVGLCPAAAATPAAAARLVEGRLAAAAARAGAQRCAGTASTEKALLASRLQESAQRLAALQPSLESMLAGAEESCALARVLRVAGCLAEDAGEMLSLAARQLRAALPVDAEERYPERMAALDAWLAEATADS